MNIAAIFTALRRCRLFSLKDRNGPGEYLFSISDINILPDEIRIENHITLFVHLFWVVKKKIGIVFSFIAVLSQQQIVDVHLVLIIVGRVFLQRISSCLVVQDDQFITFVQQIIDGVDESCEK